MAALVLEHLIKTFPGGIRAVDDLSLEVAEDELLVLMGPSGCGKTTTLRMIAGLERPTSGHVSIGGRSVDHVAPRDRNVALVFQQGALYPHLTARDNMAFGLKMRRFERSEIDRRVDQAAAALDITGLLDRRPGALSGGEQQRVALGRAIVRQPEVLLLDEPLSSLDAELRRHLRQEVRRLHQRLGVPMVYVTHDQTEAMALGQRIAVMRRGRIEQVAEPQTLYERPSNRFVASALGSPAMNFLAGKLVEREGLFEFEGDPHGGGSALSICLPERMKKLLETHRSKPLVMGFRPEHIQFRSEGVEARVTIPATVDAIERLGAETHAYLCAGSFAFLARMAAGREPNAGAMVAAGIEVERLRFFDGVTGEAL